jgi:hypothetical protein
MILRDDREQALCAAPNPRPLSLLPRRITKSNQGDSLMRLFMHNHPSGDPTRSRADIEMTQAIVAVARPLGIAVPTPSSSAGRACELEGATVDLTSATSSRCPKIP